jgi:hypothetical protein
MKPDRQLKVQYRRIEELKPNPRNPRTHSREQIRKVADSMDAFGFTSLVLIDDKDVIIAGHARVAAGRLRGMAMRGYSWDPSSQRSEKIGEIVHDLDSLGLHLDTDTVRKWLKEAAQLLPPLDHHGSEKDRKS